jgi:exodeoxyribonuclease VII large subunit
LERQGRRAVLERARTLARLSRAPAHHVARHRTRLHQQLRELRAATRRAITDGERLTRSRAANLARKSTAATIATDRAALRTVSAATTLDRTAVTALERRRRDLDRLLATLDAHDPQRTLERGYALVEDEAGEPVTSATAARTQPTLTLRFHDGRLTTHTGEPPPPPTPAPPAADAPPTAAPDAPATNEDAPPPDAPAVADGETLF